MKHIIKYQKFLESFISKSKIDEYCNIIATYIAKKTNYNFFKYYETWNIEKQDGSYKGELFLSDKTNKAFRINWKDTSNKVHSIDMWINFDFISNPDYTLLVNTDSIVPLLPNILEFFNNPKVLINESSRDAIKKSLDDATKKLKRLRSEKSIDNQNKIIDNLKAELAKIEKHTTDNIEFVEKIAEDTPSIDPFKSIELYTIQVAKGISNSLLITGTGGVGKTEIVTETLKSLNMSEEVDYEKISGTATTAALYEILFIYRNKLLVFDDCDSVFKEEEAVNILKAALDTKKERRISKLAKSSNYFSARGKTEIEIEEEYDETGKLPNKFTFTGQIIFISNKEAKSLDKALLTRTIFVDINLTLEDILDRMENILPDIFEDISLDIKRETFEYLKDIALAYDLNFTLNLRTLIHAINIRLSNTDKMSYNGEYYDVWKLLIKKYLIKGE